jgi:hypothetical protein
MLLQIFGFPAQGAPQTGGEVGVAVGGGVLHWPLIQTVQPSFAAWHWKFPWHAELHAGTDVGVG